jgi:hypothetical protein
MGVSDWRTTKKAIARGAPIAKIDGTWLTLDAFLDVWLGEQLVEASRTAIAAHECQKNE